MVDLSVVGVFARDGADTPVLMLHPLGSRKVLCLRVSPVEAFAVTMALKGRADGRPGVSLAAAPEIFGAPVFSGLLSHELMIRLIAALGGRLLAVELPRPEGGEFTAELVLKTPVGLTRLSCRPADAVTLALRGGAVIRMPASLLVHAEDMDAVMGSLSEYVRAAIDGKAPGWPPAGGAEFPAAPSESAPAGAAPPDWTVPPDTRAHIISAAKKILEQQGLHDALEKLLAEVGAPPAETASKPRLSKVEVKVGGIRRKNPPARGFPGRRDPGGALAGHDDPDMPRPSDETGAEGARRPRIRVALVRQGNKGEAEVLEEFQIPADGIPGDVLASLGLSRSEAEALGRENSDEERWAMLLRMLSPETKVPM